MINKFSTIILGCVLFAGCNIINPPEIVPTYVHIDSFTFVNTNPAYYGSSSHAINTVFATYNGIQIGVFDLPCNIPIPATGANQLILSPGIAVNGFDEQEAPYPFYTSAIDTLIPQPGKIVNYTPVTGYTSDVAMAFMESFDIGLNFYKLTGYDSVDLSGYGDDSMKVTNVQSIVFEGSGSGYINMPTYDSATEFSSFFAIPQSTPVLCEINYKSNVPIAIGLIPFSISGTATNTTPPQYNNLAFAPSPDHWTKLYVNLAEIVSVYPADEYSLVIKAAVQYGQPNGYALFDNIKVVTLKQ